MNKEILRKKYLEIRNNIENKDVKDKIIFDKVINYVKDYDIILIYVSYKSEVDTLNIIKYLLKYKKVAVPKIENNIMNFYYINSINDLQKGYFGILEPINNNKWSLSDKKSICIVPGICYNKSCFRIGYGKGFYDRFLSNDNIDTIGLTYKETIIDNAFEEKNDVRVRKIVSN